MTIQGAGRISSDSCSVCKSGPTTTPEDGEYIRCLQCGTVRTRFSYNSSIYAGAYAKNYLEYAETIVNTPLNLFRLGLISRWMKKHSKILDIGCCVGEFLRFTEKHYECAGFEPNVLAAREARKRISSQVVTHLNGNFSKIDCITMFDVLEHMEDPHAFVSQISGLLSEGGIVAVTTPNVGCIPQWGDEMLRRWKHYKPKEHLFLYEEKSLEALFSVHGFESIHYGTEESDIRPGNPNGDILTFVARKSSREHIA